MPGTLEEIRIPREHIISLKVGEKCPCPEQGVERASIEIVIPWVARIFVGRTEAGSKAKSHPGFEVGLNEDQYLEDPNSTWTTELK